MQAYLATLPAMAEETAGMGPRELLQRFRCIIEDLKAAHMVGIDAMHLTTPYYLCHDYRLCVLCEAVARSTGIPAVFYMDSLRCSAMSLLNKEAVIYAGGYASKARPWYCGIADPGTGKSHAADPHIDIVVDACKALPGYAIGEPDDAFHVLRVS